LFGLACPAWQPGRPANGIQFLDSVEFPILRRGCQGNVGNKIDKDAGCRSKRCGGVLSPCRRTGTEFGIGLASTFARQGLEAGRQGVGGKCFSEEGVFARRTCPKLSAFGLLSVRAEVSLVRGRQDFRVLTGENDAGNTTAISGASSQNIAESRGRQQNCYRKQSKELSSICSRFIAAR